MIKLFSRFTNVPRSIRDRLNYLIADWTAKRADGVTSVQELFDFTRKAIDEAMAIVEELADGKLKKALVLEVAGALFDFFEPKLWSFLPVWLIWIRFFVPSDARDRFLTAVSNWIETLWVEKYKPLPLPNAA